MDAAETDDRTLIGEEAHIVAREDAGPRGDPQYALDRRDMYGNLILLCCNHHTLVDGQPTDFTVERLQTFKSDHEQWVRLQLSGFDAAAQLDAELVASVVDEWVQKCHLDRWSTWTARLVQGGGVSIAAAFVDQLETFGKWLFSRVWPDGLPLTRDAFGNFNMILSDLLAVLSRAGDEQGSGDRAVLILPKKWKRLVGKEWNQALEDDLSLEYDAHSALIEKLAIELTRSANLVCTAIRSTILPSFRLKEGVLTITLGPYEDLSYQTLRPEYPNGTAARGAYTGLNTIIGELTVDQQRKLRGAAIRLPGVAGES